MTVSEPSPRSNRRLDTWKEIGAFFDRDERTVKRWETTRGLPVHRVPGAGRANVYAYTDELADWLSGAKIAAEQDADANSDSPDGIAVEPEAATNADSNSQTNSEVNSEVNSETNHQTGTETGVPASVDARPLERRVGERRKTESAARTMQLWSRLPALSYAAAIAAVLVVAFLAVSLVRRASLARPVRAGTAVARHHTPTPEAEQLYLKGMYYWQKRTPESLHEAVDYFTQAVVRDPMYAQAYVGLANCYNLLREFSLMPASEAYPRAMAAAQRAIALDDSLSDAHTALGFADFYWSWDAAGAQREFVRALTLDPNSVIAHHWYGTFLLHLGRYPESLEEIEKAQKLDPNSAPILADKGLILFYAGQKEQGTEQLKQLAAAEPDFLSPHKYLTIIHLAQGENPQYLAECRKSATLLRDQTRLAVVAAGEKGLARGGSRGMWSEMLRDQQRLYAAGQETAYDLARSYAMLGEKQEALQYLQSAFVNRDSEIPAMRVDPAFAGLHDDPHFREILARVGLPPLPQEASSGAAVAAGAHSSD
jgi:tetratricopeptide (TPR) repeat protein